MKDNHVANDIFVGILVQNKKSYPNHNMGH